MPNPLTHPIPNLPIPPLPHHVRVGPLVALPDKGGELSAHEFPGALDVDLGACKWRGARVAESRLNVNTMSGLVQRNSESLPWETEDAGKGRTPPQSHQCRQTPFISPYGP